MAKIADLLRMAGYDPFKPKTTLEGALAPTGIDSYGGDPYVGSTWTRFSDLPTVNAFDQARNTAFKRWARQVSKGMGSSTPMRLYQQGEVSGVPAWAAEFNVNGQPINVTENHYDTWTKKGLDPTMMLRQQAGTYKATGNPFGPTGVPPGLAAPSRVGPPPARRPVGVNQASAGRPFVMSDLLRALPSRRAGLVR